MIRNWNKFLFLFIESYRNKIKTQILRLFGLKYLVYFVKFLFEMGFNWLTRIYSLFCFLFKNSFVVLLFCLAFDFFCLFSFDQIFFSSILIKLISNNKTVYKIWLNQYKFCVLYQIIYEIVWLMNDPSNAWKKFNMKEKCILEVDFVRFYFYWIEWEFINKI